MPITDGKHYVRPELGLADRGAATIIDLVRAHPGAPRIPDPAPGPPTGLPVIARVDHGRWIGDCRLRNPAASHNPDDPGTWPTCGNAQFVDFDDPRFYCVACHNVANGGRWRPVTLPGSRAAVEASLAGLPAEAQQWPPVVAAAKPDGPLGPGEIPLTPAERAAGGRPLNALRGDR